MVEVQAQSNRINVLKEATCYSLSYQNKWVDSADRAYRGAKGATSVYR